MVLFFKKKQKNLLFLKKKKQKDFYVLVLAALCVGPAQATTRSEAARKLQDAERQRAESQAQQQKATEETAAAQAQSLKLGEQRVQAAEALRAAQAQVADATARLGAARAAQAQAEDALRQRAAEFTALVPLMLRMSRYPAETVLAIPAPPDRALQGILLAGGIAATLNQKAATLREDAAKASAARAATQREASALASRQMQEAASAAALDKAMQETRARLAAAEAQGRAAAEQVAAYGAQAGTLRDAIAAMDAARAAAIGRAAQEAASATRSSQPKALAGAKARQAALARPAMRGAAGRFVTPIAAGVERGYGAPTLDGSSTGITFAPAPGAYVISPCAGRVAFAAPFRSYGQLVILECGGGIDVVLAGLGTLETAPGRPVHEAEPLGRMATAGKASLYVELRAHGEPVDPAPFLNARG